MFFFIFLLIVLIIILFVKNSNLKARASKLESELEDVREQQRYQNQKLESIESMARDLLFRERVRTRQAGEEEPDLPELSVMEDIRTEPGEKAETPEEAELVAIFEANKRAAEEAYEQAALSASPEIAPEKTPSKRSEFIAKIEKQLMENWTGILGAVALVMGAGFLGIYAALKLEPLFRFLMIACFSAVLFGIGFYAGSKERWSAFSQWLKSSGAAIMLFACLGAGSIEGLKWIDNSAAAVAVLGAGICVNMFTGFYSGRQFAISFHTILSLVALIIPQQSPLTLGIAASVAVLGIVLTRRSQWEYHLLVTITGFMLFHGAWYHLLGQPAASDMPAAMRITGICALLLTGALTALVPYSSVYRETKFAPLPFIVHLLNWFYMALGFFAYSTGSKWNTIILVAAAGSIYMLSRLAGKMKTEWLRTTDALIAQSALMFSIYTLERWGLQNIMISSVLVAETLVFYYVMVREDIKTGKYVGAYLHHAAWLIFIGCAAMELYHPAASKNDWDALYILVTIVFGLAANICLEKKPAYLDSLRWYFIRPAAGVSLSGILVCGAGLVLYGSYYEHIWAGYVFAALSCACMIVRQRLQANGLGIGLCLMNLGAYLIIWINLGAGNLTAGGWTVESAAALYILPFLLNALALIRFSYLAATGRRYAWIGIYPLAVSCAVATYAATNEISVFIPGVAWLLLSLLFLETSRYVSSKVRDHGAAVSLLTSGYMFVLIFLARHVFVHLQSHFYMGPVPVRFVVAVFAVAVLLYWALTRLNDAHGKITLTMHGLMWELIIVFSLASVVFEVSDIWLGLVFASAAFILLSTGHFIKALSRMRFYALIMSYAAAVAITFVAGSHVTPSVLWYDQGWVAGCAGLLVYFGFLFAFHARAGLSSINPGPVRKLDRLASWIEIRSRAFLFYPFFAALAMFMFWSFDKSLLTLLWVFEAFVIFVLSIVFKEQHFRYIAMTGLAGCLIRLVFYDLSKSTTLTRAIVFLGVGAIMLLINSLYNKYKDRFAK